MRKLEESDTALIYEYTIEEILKALNVPYEPRFVEFSNISRILRLTMNRNKRVEVIDESSSDSRNSNSSKRS